MAKFLIRLDDACETMDPENWKRIETLLDKFRIRPLLSVIPDNKDKEQIRAPHDPSFWNWVRSVEKKGWEICLHGNTHQYLTDSGGLNPVHYRSEFAGLPLEIQRNSIREGIRKFKENGINPRVFVPPGHTFDINTLQALKMESEINIISDTIAFYPYFQSGFIFIPLQFGYLRNVRIPGLFTFCYHPNTMSGDEINAMEMSLIKLSRNILCLNELNLNDLRSVSYIDKFYSFLYFKYRKLRKKAKRL